jgi:DNA-binding MarR family transcriptional regulator
MGKKSLREATKVDRASAADEFRAFGTEAALAYFRLVALLEHVHGRGTFSYGGRSLLISLVDGGPTTVPELARVRLVSRQYVQQLVDDLAKDGLVVFADNPAHRRSKLVGVTGKGRRKLASMFAREEKVLGEIAGELPRASLRSCTAFLSTVRSTLDRRLAPPRRGVRVAAASP